MKRFIMLLSIWLSMLAPSMAQIGSAENYMTANVYLSYEKVVPGQSVQLAVEFTLNPEYHVNSNTPSEEFAIPTVLKITPGENISVGRILYPKGEKKQFEFSDVPLEVYDGKNTIWSSLSIPTSIQPGTYKIHISLEFQACNDQSCFAPTALEKEVNLQIVDQNEQVLAINQDIFSKFPEHKEEKIASESGLASKLQSEGLFLFLIIVFLAGLALNLTPCVYPLIPITIAYFANQGKDKGSVVVHAFLYFAGMVIMYSSLGVIAALSGGILGAWLQNPIVVIGVALLMVALATSMFGFWEIRMPQSIANAAGKSRVGYGGTLLMGLMVGFIAAPCIGPFVLSLITLVAEQGDPLKGFIMFLALAMGIGLPYLLLGIFSGAMNKIPRSGGWMVWVRNLFGFVLLAMAVYFIDPLLNNDTIYYILMGLLAVSAGIYSFVDKNQTFSRPQVFKSIKIIFGVLLIVAGILVGYPKEKSAESHLNWKKYSPAIYEEALNSGKPVMMDFYATWCIPCKELDKFTFSDPVIRKMSEEFYLIKIDLTKNNVANNELRKKFNVKGVPTILFINRSGEVQSDISFVGFKEARDLVNLMKTAQAR